MFENTKTIELSIHDHLGKSYVNSIKFPSSSFVITTSLGIYDRLCAWGQTLCSLIVHLVLALPLLGECTD